MFWRRRIGGGVWKWRVVSREDDRFEEGLMEMEEVIVAAMTALPFGGVGLFLVALQYNLFKINFINMLGSWNMLCIQNYNYFGLK